MSLEQLMLLLCPKHSMACLGRLNHAPYQLYNDSESPGDFPCRGDFRSSTDADVVAVVSLDRRSSFWQLLLPSCPSCRSSSACCQYDGLCRQTKTTSEWQIDHLDKRPNHYYSSSYRRLIGGYPVAAAAAAADSPWCHFATDWPPAVN